MSKTVSELIENGSPQSNILNAAEQSDEYTEVSRDDKYLVFRGSDYLVVGIPNEGLYTEDLNNEPEDGYRFTFIDQDPWDAARKTTYNIDGNWEDIVDEIIKILPEESSSTQIEEWGTSEREGYGLLGTKSLGEFYIPVNDENGEAVLEFSDDSVTVYEKGEVDMPGMEEIDSVQIDKIISGAIDEHKSSETSS